MQTIYLIGMRGVGKSTAGKLLAQKLEREFVDLDKKIEQKAGKIIAEIVEKAGWESFRAYEREALREAANRDEKVISTGGGILIDLRNAELMKASGKLILLSAEPQTLRHRLANTPDRPSLTGSHFLQEIEAIWNERKDRYYHFADQVISTDGKTPEQIIQEILHEL